MNSNDGLARYVGHVRRKVVPKHVPVRCDALSMDAQETLREVVRRDSPRNPWTRAYVRIRNEVVIQLLLQLGLRCSELLEIKIDDFMFGDGSIETCGARDRRLPLSDELSELMREWLRDTRPKIKGADRHTCLLVDCDTGSPLTHTGLHRIFDTIRRSFPKPLSALTANAMRRTWHVNLARLMAAQDLSAEDTRRLRCHFIGWRDARISNLCDQRVAQVPAPQALRLWLRSSNLAAQKSPFRKP